MPYDKTQYIELPDSSQQKVEWRFESNETDQQTFKGIVLPQKKATIEL